MKTPFLFCVGDASGWKRLPVEINVPDTITEIERLVRTSGERLSEEQSGQLKKFWRAADAATRLEHGVDDYVTTILKGAP